MAAKTHKNRKIPFPICLRLLCFFAADSSSGMQRFSCSTNHAVFQSERSVWEKVRRVKSLLVWFEAEEFGWASSYLVRLSGLKAERLVPSRLPEKHRSGQNEG